MFSVMGKHWFGIYQHHHSHDISICKWELNGVDLNDSIARKSKHNVDGPMYYQNIKSVRH